VFNIAKHHEDAWGSGGTAPSILNLSTRLRWTAIPASPNGTENIREGMEQENSRGQVLRMAC